MSNMSEETSKQGILEKTTPVLLVATIVMAFAVGILWQKVSNFEKGNSNTGTQVAGNEAQPVDTSGKLSKEDAAKLIPVSEKDHIKGSMDADVILIEYSDLECPYCSSFHETAQQAVEEYGDSIAWVYRHFPLDAIHPRAIPAANAAECVASLGGEEAFWNYIDSIFPNQDSALTDDELRNNAGRVGVDAIEYDSCVKEQRFNQKIEDQYNGGESAGVSGTPANFVVNKNGEVWSLPGAVPYQDLKDTIDEALAAI